MYGCWDEAKIAGRIAFDQRALLHYRYALGEAPHQIQIVRDQQHGHAALLSFIALKFEQEFDDLRADRDIERGRRFVGEQKARTARERHRDHHALPLSAR